MNTKGLSSVLIFAALLPLTGCGGDDASPESPDASTVDSSGADGAAHDGGGGDGAGTTDAGDEHSGQVDGGAGSVSADDLAAMVDQSRFTADHTTITTIRPPGSANWKMVQDLCAARLTGYGFDVELQSFHADPGAYPEFNDGVNVIGTKLGTKTPDEKVIVSAHYDHLTWCEGADDNASGVAGLLELARILSTPTFDRTLVVACWDLEEFGLKGSMAYANRERGLGTAIVSSIVFDAVAYQSSEPNSQQLPSGINLLFPEAYAQVSANQFRGDFIAIIGNDTAASTINLLAESATAAGLPSAKLQLANNLVGDALVGDLHRSDHAAFWLADYPGVLLTDTGEFRNPNYHCSNGKHDLVESTDPVFATKVVRTAVRTAALELGVQ